MASRATRKVSTCGFAIREKILRGFFVHFRKFGAPVAHDGITTEIFSARQVVYQIGVALVRIDILTDITGFEFAEAWPRKVLSTFFGVPVHFISLEDLVANKRVLGRSSDLKDLKPNPKNTKP